MAEIKRNDQKSTSEKYYQQQTSGSTSGMLLGIVGKIDWVKIENPYPLTEKPEGSF